MTSIDIDEIILALLCIAPFVVIGAGAIALLVLGDPCEEAE